MSRYLTARNVILLSGISVTLGFAVVIGYRPELLPAAATRPIEDILASVGQRVTILATGGLLALETHSCGSIGVISTRATRNPTSTPASGRRIAWPRRR